MGLGQLYRGLLPLCLLAMACPPSRAASPSEAMNFMNLAQQINTERTQGGALPVMRGNLPDPFGIARFHKEKAAELAAAAVDDDMGIQFISMRPPITHGVAPQSLTGLAPILLSEAVAAVNKIHAGRVLFLTSVGTAYRSQGVHVLCRDANEAIVLCVLYNYVLPEGDPAEVFPPGTRLAMLEPYLRFPQDNPDRPAFVRCDNPQAVRVFASTRAWERAQLGDFEADPAPSASCDALCSSGDKEFCAGRNTEAICLYSSALRVDPTSARALRNRAACNHRLGRWAAVLEDMEGALALDATHKKAAFRRAEALLLLQRPLQAREAAASGVLHHTTRP